MINYPLEYDIGLYGTTLEFAANINGTHFRTGQFPAGAYELKLYAVGNGNNILDSKSTITYNKTKLDISTADFNLSAGILHWNVVQSSVYAITVDAEKTVEIDIAENTSLVSGNIVSYELPSQIDGYKLNGGSLIIVTMYIVGDDINLLSSSLSNEIGKNKIVEPDAPAIVGGRLTWDTSNATIYTGYDILLQFTHENTPVEAVLHTNTINGYLLPDSVEAGGVTYDLADNSYTVAIKRCGNNNLFNSDYSEELEFVRLPDISGLHTESGVLKWNTINPTGYQQQYVFIGLGDTTYIAHQAEEDFETYKASSDNNSINISMYALGDDSYMTSRTTLDYRCSILPTPENLGTDSSSIIWDEVVSADKYEIVIRKMLSSSPVVYDDPVIYHSVVNSFSLDADPGEYGIQVRAISESDNDNKINSRYTDMITINKPAVLTGFTFNDELKRWEWDAVSGIQSYIFKYSLRDGNQYSDEVMVEIGSSNNYYRPVTLGIYTFVTVQAKSYGNSILSNKAQWENQSGMLEYNFNLFNAGEGTLANPYKIINATQFFNIAYYSDQCFELASNIDFSGMTITTPISKFTGKLSGGNNCYALDNATFGPSMTVTKRGLFAESEGATFTNLTIKRFTLSGGYTTSEILYAGLLVGKAKNTTFSNITTPNSGQVNIISLSTNSNISASMYFGALAGYMDGGNVENVAIHIANNISVQPANATVYFGGLTGYASNVAMSNLRVSINDTSNVIAAYTYGGVVATMVGGSINRAEIGITMTGVADIIGGVAGTSSGNIIKVHTIGNINARSYVTSQNQRNGRAGGLAGRTGSGAVVSMSYAELDIYMDATNATSEHRAYAGRLIGENNGDIVQCWVPTENGGITLNGNSNVFAGTYAALDGVSINHTTNKNYQSVDSMVAGYKSLSDMKTEAFAILLNNNAGSDIYIGTAGSLPRFTDTVPSFV